MALHADTARQYRQKYGWEMPTLKLARIMKKENENLFTSLDRARAALRRIEGKAGAKSRKEVGQKELFKEGTRPYNPYNLPKSDETDFTPFVISDHKRIAIFSDIHAPYHSIPAITEALKRSKKNKVDGVVINGDLFDFHGMSRF